MARGVCDTTAIMLPPQRACGRRGLLYAQSPQWTVFGIRVDRHIIVPCGVAPALPETISRPEQVPRDGQFALTRPPN